MLLLRNIAVELKDREKLKKKKLFELLKMFYISTNSNKKILKILNILDDDINRETCGETLLEDEINF